MEEEKDLTETGEEEEAEEEDRQQLTFGYYSEVKELWKKEWQGMPEYEHENLEPWKTLYVHFEDRKAMDNFSKLVEQSLTSRTRSIWYPEAEIGRFAGKAYVDES